MPHRGQCVVQRRVQRDDFVQAGQLYRSARRRIVGHYGDLGRFADLLVGGHQDPQTHRCHEAHCGEFNDKNGRVFVKRSGEGRFKGRRGTQIDFAADAYYGYPCAVSNGCGDRTRS